MKISKYLALGFLVISLTPVFGQPAPTPPALISTPLGRPPSMPRFGMRLQTDADTPILTKFNLDFSGGTPKQLVAAIQKATGKPLNAIIQEEDADTKLPSLKMNDVNVSQLFEALEEASIKQVGYYPPSGGYQTFTASCGFITEGTATDNSIWRFHVENPPSQPGNSSAPILTKFNLDFPGGTPKQLIAALEKAIGKSLNIVVSDKDADEKLPPLKMNNVDLIQLSHALRSATYREEFIRSLAGGGFVTQAIQVGVSFDYNHDEQPSDSLIWYFNVQRVPPPAPPEKASRFFQLSSYLENGYTVDDITTAIQTGWKMQGDTSPPEISFHKETKLLIAVGEPKKLLTIEAVLAALEIVKPPVLIDPSTGLPLPAAKPNAEKSGK